MDDEVIRCAIEKVAATEICESNKILTKSEMYRDGVSGRDGSFELRQKILTRMKLPLRLSPNAMAELINKAGLYDEYKNALAAEADKNG